MNGGLFIILAVATCLLDPVQGTGQSKSASPGVQPLQDPPGIHNLYLLGTNVYSGSTPEGEEGFEGLAKLGVSTIVSVDGAKPDVELAKKHGMRYVHLPHGYDGIGTNLQIQLAKAGLELSGPLYVHCHHGKHRGPAAAAIVCMAKDSWDAAQAEQWLRAAGTSTNYSGLYEAVRKFKNPTAAHLRQVPSDFPEVAKVSGLVEAMVSIDERWEHLKAVRAANYVSPPSHPDIQPANEAVILWENYRESQRLPAAVQLGGDFMDRLKTAEGQVQQAEELLRKFAATPNPDIRAHLDRSFDAISKTCASCHKAYRDVK